MPILAVIGSSAGSGRFVPDKPIITHSTQTGQFVISNYNSSLTYNISVSAGSATRNADIISLSSGDSICTVYASTQKGTLSNTAATCERKSYTYSSGQNCTNNCQPGGGPSGANSCWCGSSSDGYQTCCGGCYGQTCTSYNVKNSTPSGYTDSYSEWWKVS